MELTQDTSGIFQIVAGDTPLLLMLPGLQEGPLLQKHVLGLTTMLRNHVEKEIRRLDSKCRQVYFRESEKSSH